MRAGRLRRCPATATSRQKLQRQAIDLAECLLDILPATMSKAFFNSSGSEANDTAIKLCRY